jgi:hypothetical protein
MTPPIRFTLSILLVATTWMACTPPPEPEEPTGPTAGPSEPKPPPPSPKCTSLDDKCKAEVDTRASIAGVGHRFTPPAGWYYAELATATIAQPDADGPVLAVSSFKAEEADAALRKQREERLAALCEMAGLTLPAKTAIAKPDDMGEAGDMRLSFWQKEGVKRGSEEGSLLVFAGMFEGTEIFGVGFVPASDTSNADKAIQTSIESLRIKPGDSGPPAKEAEEKGKAP